MRTRLCGLCAAPAMRRERFDRQAVSAGPSWRHWPRRTACPCRKADDCELGTASVGTESPGNIAPRSPSAPYSVFRPACRKLAGAAGRETPAAGGETAQSSVRNLFSQRDRVDGVWAAGGLSVGGGISPPFLQKPVFGKFPTLKTGRKRALPGLSPSPCVDRCGRAWTFSDCLRMSLTVVTRHVWSRGVPECPERSPASGGERSGMGICKWGLPFSTRFVIAPLSHSL